MRSARRIDRHPPPRLLLSHPTAKATVDGGHDRTTLRTASCGRGRLRGTRSIASRPTPAGRSGAKRARSMARPRSRFQLIDPPSTLLLSYLFGDSHSRALWTPCNELGVLLTAVSPA